MKEKHSLQIERKDGMFCLRLDSPIVLARFAAVLRQALRKESSSATLLCRGQTRHKAEMRPSLFRSKNDTHQVNQLLKAEQKVIEQVQARGLKRFIRPDLPALLQHYGVSTSWLDVVDNLFVSVWFATHYYDKAKNAYFPSDPQSEGWIYFISTHTSAGRLRFIDLRELHHHLSVRPHIQHGWSVTLNDKDWDDCSRGLGSFIVAAVTFRRESAWKLDSGMFTQNVLFPSPEYDNTLKVLRETSINKILRNVERNCGLSKDSLGSLFQPLNRMGSPNNGLNRMR